MAFIFWQIQSTLPRSPEVVFPDVFNIRSFHPLYPSLLTLRLLTPSQTHLKHPHRSLRPAENTVNKSIFSNIVPLMLFPTHHSIWPCFCSCPGSSTKLWAFWGLGLWDIYFVRCIIRSLNVVFITICWMNIWVKEWAWPWFKHILFTAACRPKLVCKSLCAERKRSRSFPESCPLQTAPRQAGASVSPLCWHSPMVMFSSFSWIHN